MKRIGRKPKAVDFISKLRNSILFTEDEIAEITARCNKDKSVTGVMAACTALQIGLGKTGIYQLCHIGLAL
jgi:hypothetical protein